MAKKILILATLLLTALAAQAVTKRALLVGVGQYKSSDWGKPLHSLNDVALLKGVLIENGFKKENIVTVTKENASKEGIVNALIKFTKECHNDDIVLIHFSGHGQRIVDIYGYRAHRDSCFIEAFIPYNAEKYYSKSLTAKNHLTDYEIRQHINIIRKKLGPKGFLLMSTDACHSGGMSRNADAIAGDDDEYPDSVMVRGDGNVFGITKLKPAKFKTYPPTPKNYSPFVELSACRSYEKNHEYLDRTRNRVYGSLSYMMYLGLKEKIRLQDLAKFVTGPKQEKIRRKVMPKQHPYIDVSH